MTKTTQTFLVTVTKIPGQNHEDTREQIQQALDEEVDAGYFDGVEVASGVSIGAPGDNGRPGKPGVTVTKTEHVAQFCQIPGCSNEAERWIGDPSDKYTNNTFYFCLEHPKTEEAEESGFMINSAGELEEVAVYSCAETCADCNP